MPKTVTKADLIDLVATKVGDITKRQAAEAVDAVLDGVTDHLSMGDKVQLTGFGTFEVRLRKARMGRNPADTSQVIHIPEQNAPVFKAGKRLKDAVK